MAYQSNVQKFGQAVWTGLSSGLAAGVSSWRYGFSDPTDINSKVYSARISQYDLGWMAYNNSFFENYATLYSGLNPLNANQNTLTKFVPWPTYLERRKLYRYTQPFYNPVRRLVDFYAGHVFPGVLSEDGALLPDGVALAIPISRDASQPLKSAIAQGWANGNWHQNKGLWIKFCAATGDGPVELIDDFDEGCVYAEPVWPGEISLVEFHNGKVIHYVREYWILDDETQERYLISKEVTPDKFSTYKDGELHSINGLPSEYDNPYGFCPMVWNQHVPSKTLPGGQACRNWNKIEKLNSLATRVNNYLTRQTKTPMLLPNSQNVRKIKVDASMEDELQVLTTDGGGGIEKLEGNLQLADVEVRIQHLWEEVLQDHPEVQVYSRLRELSQITGPAVEQLMGDVSGYLSEARSGYDAAEIRKNELLVAMSGFRYSEGKGGWAKRTWQQKKFADFNLDSLVNGDLEHTIDARPLMTASKLQQATAKLTVAQAYSASEAAGFPLTSQLEAEGWTPEQIIELQNQQDAQHHRELMQLEQTLAVSNSFSSGDGTNPAVAGAATALESADLSESQIGPENTFKNAPKISGAPLQRGQRQNVLT